MPETRNIHLQLLNATPPWEWPPTAAETLKQALRDTRGAPSNRLLAADLGGDLVVMDDEMAELLLSIAGSAADPEQLRAKAAISLGPALDQTDVEGFDEPLSDPPVSEELFQRIQQTLRDLYMDRSLSKELRRRLLEASVRAPQDWHADAIRAAYSSGDEDWKLTAVFGMRWVRGFDEQIVEALESGNREILYEAVQAAGNWQVTAAWPRIAGLISSSTTRKALRLACIEAAGWICPLDDRRILEELADSPDEEIQDAAMEAMEMMETREDGGEDEEEDDDAPPRRQ